MKVRPVVKRFAAEMEKQLVANAHKGSWKECGEDFLYGELEGILNENLTILDFALANADTPEVLSRCANIANFAMMIADNWGGLSEREGHEKERQIGILEHAMERIVEQALEHALEHALEQVMDHIAKWEPKGRIMRE